MALMAEQAGEELAFGGQPQTRAVAAERLGDGGDDPDLAGTVEEAPALGHLTGIVRIDRGQRMHGVDARDDVAAGQHFFHAPAVAGTHVHVFDEAQDVSSAAEMLDHGQDLAVVQATAHHHVDLDAGETGLGSGLDASQHAVNREVGVVELAKQCVVQSVQADRDAIKPGLAQ